MEFWGFRMLNLLKFYIFIITLLHFLFGVLSWPYLNSEYRSSNFLIYHESMTVKM